jgi:hypothetical protein
MNMNTTNIVRLQPADAFSYVQSSTRERLMNHVNKEAFYEMTFIAVTVSMAIFLSHMCYHALRSYGAL